MTADTPLVIVALGVLATAMASCIGLLILQLGLWRVFAVAPQLQAAADAPVPQTSLTVVIPAYNEAGNIGACLASVLNGQPPCVEWQVLVVDDDSTDAIRRALAQAITDQADLLSLAPRLTC